MKNISLFLLFILVYFPGRGQNTPGERDFLTYCNPIDIDYTYVAHNSYTGVSYRAGADPAVINFKGKFFMFVTRSYGYWVSDDMSNWEFITPQNWYFNGSNAPAAAVHGDKIIVAGDPSGRMAIISTDTPEVGDWKTSYSVLPISIQDPALFVDDDGKVFLYEESSNKHPLYGVELDPDNNYLPKGEETALIQLDPEAHGWERFGQDHSSEMAPYLEGPWMTKHNGTYYLQYGAPGTEFNVYADGVYTGDNPLGPFEYAPYNPVSYKPGGFVTGAGHGSTVQDNNGNYWHFATMPIAVNYKFERRIGLFPAGFENNGQMYVNTAYGDYPHYLPTAEVKEHKNRFTGWMLLSYGKKVTANSVLDKKVEQKVIGPGMKSMVRENTGYDPANMVDENISSFWVAKTNDRSVEASIDLGETMKIHALQVNFHEFNAEIFGRQPGIKHQFIIEASENGKKWDVIADYSENQKDQPHAYIAFETPTDARYVRYRNISTPNEYLAISGFRIFGKGYGKAPEAPENFQVHRQEDRRNADLKWDPVKGATGYVIYWGIEEDKLNNSVLIYGEPEYNLRALNIDQAYYSQVEAFNENGISQRTKIQKVQ
ncbi:F5/8 type C domain-containing protein [Salinimicrobium catena]|uniref:F5/8 type C domain-containing protein n=1 Tax=Salinimicrobium catena TaxID=390640 RepID=A0A1H5IRV8_9FLAO|nr:family 43 glycosylhydrolase [Salinimicrobium catena]SDK80028.1 F5/8 type C domain-containing protein [Salinimicrobium catena]SEE42942.1 F5/8 type C domain-containing protein [Salinimicrobium catena]